MHNGIACYIGVLSIADIDSVVSLLGVVEICQATLMTTLSRKCTLDPQADRFQW